VQFLVISSLAPARFAGVPNVGIHQAVVIPAAFRSASKWPLAHRPFAGHDASDAAGPEMKPPKMQRPSCSPPQRFAAVVLVFGSPARVDAGNVR